MHSMIQTRASKNSIKGALAAAVTTACMLLLCTQPVAAYDYRPYFEWTGTPLKSTKQPKLFMAFGLRYGNNPCVPGFEHDLKAGIVGQDMILSFGGELGTYINQGCTNPIALEYNLLHVVDVVKPIGLDFDLEMSSGHCYGLKPLAEAIAGVKAARPEVIVGVTISAGENGISTTKTPKPGECVGSTVLGAFHKAGVQLDYINVMNMYLSTPDKKVTSATYLKVMNASLDSIRKRVGYCDWPLEKLGMTFTTDGGNGKMTVARAKDLVKHLPQELGFISMWQYADWMTDGGAAEMISRTFRNAAKTRFGPLPVMDMSCQPRWGFGSGENLSFKFMTKSGDEILTNGGPKP